MNKQKRREFISDCPDCQREKERAAYQRIIAKLLRQMKRAAKRLNDPDAVKLIQEIESEMAELEKLNNE